MCVTVSAFYVGVTSSSVNEYLTKIPFDLVNFSNSIYNTPYNTLTNTFSVTQPSLYWFHLNAGVPAGSGTNFSLNGLNYSAVVYSSAVVYPQDQLTTDTLQYVWPNSKISVSNSQPLFSSSNLETAFLGFRLDNMFSPLVAFGVQLAQVVNITGVIKFNRILVNEGNGYNISEGAFITPVTGSYFFSVTVLTRNTIYVYVNSIVNKKLTVCLCDDAHSSTDQVSSRGSVMLALLVNDKVQVHASTLISTVNDGLFSFQGFLYSPLFRNLIAWSVSRTSNILGPADYVPFSAININTAACCWNATFNNVTIPTSGIYYVDLTSFPCGSAYSFCQGYGNNTIQILRNGSPIITIRLTNATFNFFVSRSRSTIVSLNVGDELRVRTPTNSCYFSSAFRQMTFSGFLLY